VSPPDTLRVRPWRAQSAYARGAAEGNPPAALVSPPAALARLGGSFKDNFTIHLGLLYMSNLFAHKIIFYKTV
jgi:hypothetical protein